MFLTFLCILFKNTHSTNGQQMICVIFYRSHKNFEPTHIVKTKTDSGLGAH
jgi:hypothetical protein